MTRKKADSADTQQTGVKNPQSEAPAEGPAETQNTQATGGNDGEGEAGGAGDGGEPGKDAGGAVAAGAGESADRPGMFTSANAQIAGLPPAVAAAAMHEAHKGYLDVKGNKVDMSTVFEKQGPKGRMYRVKKRVFEETTVPGNPGATRRRLVYGEGRVIPDHEYLEAMDGAEGVLGTGDAGQRAAASD